jgi:hypothetical protein
MLFRQDFDFKVSDRVTIAYKANRKYLVSQRCADEAIKTKKAELTERPNSNASR